MMRATCSTASRVRGLLGLLGFVLSLGPTAPRAFAQAPAQAPAAGTLRVTVVDQTGAVIVGATVTVTGAENATSAATSVPMPAISRSSKAVSGAIIAAAGWQPA